jgi:hypothetical protein
MSWIITPTYDGLVSDPDANTYLAAVQAEDGQLLEPDVRIAVNNFIVGCKADGIWDAIKTSCILAGARTLNGALVPLVGTAPTNVNFVSDDYNRKTGLAGDGSTKYLNSNRNNNADPQDSKHAAVYVSESETRNATRAAICSRQAGGTSGATHLLTTSALVVARVNTDRISQTFSPAPFTGLFGGSRSSSSSSIMRFNGINTVNVETSSTSGAVIDVFSRNGGDFSNARLAFYSIGESLDLALLDTRVTTLMSDLAAAIP